jgi:hypothetical protein
LDPFSGRWPFGCRSRTATAAILPELLVRSVKDLTTLHFSESANGREGRLQSRAKAVARWRECACCASRVVGPCTRVIWSARVFLERCGSGPPPAGALAHVGANRGPCLSSARQRNVVPQVFSIEIADWRAV